MSKKSLKTKAKGCPRPYSLGKRQKASDDARNRCIEAANALLADSNTPVLKLEDVATRAGITRQTIYNLFGSKTELIEAVFDHLARAGGMEDMAAAMQQRDPEIRLSSMVMTLARFWTTRRTTTRHIRTMAATDPDLSATIRARDERRRMACQHVLRGFGQTLSTAARTPIPSHQDLLWAIIIIRILPTCSPANTTLRSPRPQPSCNSRAPQ